MRSEVVQGPVITSRPNRKALRPVANRKFYWNTWSESDTKARSTLTMTLEQLIKWSKDPRVRKVAKLAGGLAAIVSLIMGIHTLISWQSPLTVKGQPNMTVKRDIQHDEITVSMTILAVNPSLSPKLLSLDRAVLTDASNQAVFYGDSDINFVLPTYIAG
jgi:hypothetical protein